MRNTLLATSLVLAGVSTKVGVLNPPPLGGAHSDSKASQILARHADLSEDHPIAVFYDYFHPIDESKKKGAGEVSARMEIDLSGSKRSRFEGKLKATGTAENSGTGCETLQPEPGTDPKFLIALLPDPQRTHLALSFDRYLESIMSAAADSGFLFDRYWLPWRLELPSEGAGKSGEGQDDGARRVREMLPGLLLFRDSKHLLNPLVVFIVGETPTAGVERHQFHNAVCFIRRLGASHAVTLRILGPSFTGSLDSLNQALGEEQEAKNGGRLDEIQILSGAVTGAIGSFADMHPGFRTVGHTFNYTFKVVLDHLQPRRVALLAEDTTQFGRSVGYRDPGEITRWSIKTIYYPREISRLRNAYQEDPELSSREKGQNLPGQRQQLALGLKDTQIGRDAVPQFSAEQTAITQETVLFNIADTLRRETIDLAVLTGTNVLDLLFLSRFLRQSTPDVRLALVNSDLLFVHGTDTMDFVGMYVATTFPLSGWSQKWMSPHQAIRFFPNNNAQGVYNAGLLLLCPSDQNPRLREYSTTDWRNGEALVWLSVIGRGGYWPVAALPEKYDGGDRFSERAEASVFLKPYRPSRSWTGIFWICNTLLLWYSMAYFYATGRFSKANRPLPRWCSDLHPCPDLQDAAGRCLFLLLTAAFLLGADVSLALAPVRLFWCMWPWSVKAGAVVVSFALLLVVLDISLRLYDIRWRLAIPVALGVILILTGLTTWVATADSPTFFQAVRSVNLASGVAPNLPILLLLLALAWWSWVGAQRFVFRTERNPGSPVVHNLPKDLPETLKSNLGKPLPGLAGLTWIIPLGTFIVTLIIAQIVLRSMESKLYDAFFAALLALVVALIFGTAFSFSWLWRNLQRYTEALELHPIREALSVLPSIASWSPIWEPSVRKRRYVISGRSIDCLRALDAHRPSYYDGLKDHLDALVNAEKAILDKVTKGERETPADVEAAFAIIAKVNGKLVEELEAKDWKQGSSDTVNKLEEATHPDDAKQQLETRKRADLLASEFLALRFVAFIRYVLLHMRNLLSFLTVGFILVAVALNCYAFQGAGFCRWGLTAMFLILAMVVINVLVQIERDVTLRRITDTKEGTVQGSLYLRLISVGILPLLAVLASQFPSIGRFLFSWVQPALEQMH